MGETGTALPADLGGGVAEHAHTMRTHPMSPMHVEENFK
jgi:hypothetical protein